MSANMKNGIKCEFAEDFEDVQELIEDVLPDPSLLEFYRRLKKREILWNDEIDDTTIDIALYIKKWNEEDRGIAAENRKPIKISSILMVAV